MRTGAMLVQISTQGSRQILWRRQGQTVLRRSIAHGHGVITTDSSTSSTPATCTDVNASPHTRQFHGGTLPRGHPASSAAASNSRSGGRRSGGSTGGGRGDAYVSPFASFFDSIERDGRTSSGLGPDDVNPSISPVNRDEAEELSVPGGRFLQCGIAEDVLKFKTVSWGRMFTPPYVKPGEHQITLRCPMKFIPFRNEKEREIFLQLVEGRYNPKREEVQLVCNLFASRIENKRHVVSMLDRLVLASRKLALEAE